MVWFDPVQWLHFIMETLKIRDWTKPLSGSKNVQQMFEILSEAKFGIIITGFTSFQNGRTHFSAQAWTGTLCEKQFQSSL